MLDQDWQTRVNWILAYLDSCNAVKLYDYQIGQHATLLQATTDGFDRRRHVEGLQTAYNRIISLMLPWSAVGGQSLQELSAKLTQRYIETFGDPSSQEFQAEAAKLLAYWDSIQKG